VSIQCNFGKRQNQRHKHFNKHFRSNQMEDENYDDMGGSQDSGNDMTDLNNTTTNPTYGYMNNGQRPRIGLLNNGDQNFGSFTQHRGTDVNVVYGRNPLILDQGNVSFHNTLATNGLLQPQLAQFNTLPPGPYLAPPALYGKTLDALAAVSPAYIPFNKQPSPSPAMLSPPNLPNTNFPSLVSPPNPMHQNPPDVFLQLSGLNHLANANQNTLATNLGIPTNATMPNTGQTTNFTSLLTMLPPTSLPRLNQSLSPNWGATAGQGLNSVASLPSVNNAFTGSPLMNVNKSTSFPQSNVYGNFSLNYNMNGLHLSPPNLPVKDK